MSVSVTSQPAQSVRIIEDRQTVALTNEVVSVVSVGIQGPPGGGAESVVTAQGMTVVGDASGDPMEARLPFWDITWSGATAYPDGTAYASMTDSAAAIASAITTAASLGVPVVGRGRYRVDSTITLAIDHDFTGAEWVCSSTSIAPVVRIGTATSGSTVSRLRGVAPRITNAVKVVGAGWTGSSVGIELANLYSSDVSIPYVTGFTTGALMTAYGTGNVYNVIRPYHLSNNQRNLVLTPNDTTAWVNENTILGGRLSFESAEGTAVAGTRQVLLETVNGGNSVNNNRLIGLSVEGNVPEYHVEFKGAAYNALEYCRWEAATPKVWFNDTAGGAGSTDNLIFYGYSAHLITVTEATNSERNQRYSRAQLELELSAGADGALIVSNRSSSAYPALTILQAGDSAYSVDPATAYTAAIGANSSKFKRAADAFPRIHIDHVNGRVYFGNSGSEPTLYLSNFGSAGLQTSSYFKVGTVASLPAASSGLRGMKIRVEGGTGVADKEYICMKTAADAYAWVETATG